MLSYCPFLSASSLTVVLSLIVYGVTVFECIISMLNSFCRDAHFKIVGGDFSFSSSEHLASRTAHVQAHSNIEHCVP